MTQPKSLLDNRFKKSPSNSSLHQWLQFLVQFVKRVMVDLKKRIHHTSITLSTNPNLYQTNELKKLEVGERSGNVLLQLLPQLVSPENNQKWNPEAGVSINSKNGVFYKSSYLRFEFFISMQN